jgi:hypothetical protein
VSAIVAAILLWCLLAAGCGGSSSSDSAGAAAQRFVSAVTNDDRSTWCEQIGEAMLVASRNGGLVGPLLSQCKSQDLFAITGDCDRERVISGASVTHDHVDGNRADVSLSSGAKLSLRRSQGKWYVTSVSGGTPKSVKRGLCAGG